MNEKLTFEIDAEDRFLDASPAWDRFAAANEAPELAVSRIRGRLISDFISDPETRELQRMILAQARRSPSPLVYTIRCDSPTRLRLIQLAVASPDKAKVRIESTTLRSEPSSSGSLLARNVQRLGGHLRICSWCRRVELASQWLDPAEAAQALGLFESMPIPQLTHGMCEDCSKKISAVAGS